MQWCARSGVHVHAHAHAHVAMCTCYAHAMLCYAMHMQAGAVGVVFGGAELHDHAIYLLAPYTVRLRSPSLRVHCMCTAYALHAYRMYTAWAP